MLTFNEALRRGRTTTDEALALFDSFDRVELDVMIGTWRGDEFPTGHRLDGSLRATGWYGKQIIDAETVHPLLLYTRDHRAAFPVAPAAWPTRLTLPTGRGQSYHGLIAAARPLIRARRPGARLRMTDYRGRTSATMTYNSKPINDIFRQVTNDTIFGVMDICRERRPYFFVLRRDDDMPVLG